MDRRLWIISMISIENCPLCKNNAHLFDADQFYQCSLCQGIFRSRDFYLSLEQEKERYLKHNNDVQDIGYRKFISLITQEILLTFNQNHLGLDFGSGPGPVISKVLQEQGYDIVQYDPFFQPDPRRLDATYNCIACCEVIEHFHHPMKEFLLLKRLLKPHGRLYCMTHLYDQQIDFRNWYYKNDPSHVFFYTEETLEWIASNCQYANKTINGRLVIFEND